MELPYEIVEHIFYFIPLDILYTFDNEISKRIYEKRIKVEISGPYLLVHVNEYSYPSIYRKINVYSKDSLFKKLENLKIENSKIDKKTLNINYDNILCSFSIESNPFTSYYIFEPKFEHYKWFPCEEIEKICDECKWLRDIPKTKPKWFVNCCYVPNRYFDCVIYSDSLEFTVLVILILKNKKYNLEPTPEDKYLIKCIMANYRPLDLSDIELI